MLQNLAPKDFENPAVKPAMAADQRYFLPTPGSLRLVETDQACWLHRQAVNRNQNDKEVNEKNVNEKKKKKNIREVKLNFE